MGTDQSDAPDTPATRTPRPVKCTTHRLHVSTCSILCSPCIAPHACTTLQFSEACTVQGHYTGLCPLCFPCAQVQGSQGEAGKGTLQLMLGGDQDDVPQPDTLADKVLSCLGSQRIHVGPVGSAASVSAVHRRPHAATAAASTDAIAPRRKCDSPPQEMRCVKGQRTPRCSESNLCYTIGTGVAPFPLLLSGVLATAEAKHQPDSGCGDSGILGLPAPSYPIWSACRHIHGTPLEAKGGFVY